jgi:hypothetical protein
MCGGPFVLVQLTSGASSQVVQFAAARILDVLQQVDVVVLELDPIAFYVYLLGSIVQIVWIWL